MHIHVYRDVDGNRLCFEHGVKAVVNGTPVEEMMAVQADLDPDEMCYICREEMENEGAEDKRRDNQYQTMRRMRFEESQDINQGRV